MNVHTKSVIRRPWLLALLLAPPAFLPIISHYIGFQRIGLFPTGWIQYDQPSYYAYARELIDLGPLALTYGNPFTFDYSTPRIYFQPLTLIISIAERLTAADPGLLVALVGAFAVVVCIRLAIALFKRFEPNDAAGRIPTLIVFIWGGGLLTAASLLFSVMNGQQAQGIFFLDPIRGWWFQNFGRNFVFPTETVYHAIFFSAIILILDRRFSAALAALVLMSMSHPFTGIQLIAIICAWGLLEFAAIRSPVVPLWFLLACFLLGALHVGYYLIYLNEFAGHRTLQSQWALPLLLPFETFVFANVLAGSFVVWRMRTIEKAKRILQSWPNRLLLVWFTVTAVLVNHDLFMAPLQPIHFSRGYLWIPLMLLGLPAIMRVFARVQTIRPRPIAFAAAFALIFVFVFDNATWLTIRSAQALGWGANHFGLSGDPGSTVTPLARSTLGFGLTRGQLRVLSLMNDSANRDFVVVSSDSTIGYLTTVYSPLRAWRAHHYNTPFSMQRRSELYAFFDSARVNPAWKTLPILFVFQRQSPWVERLGLLEPGSATVVLTDSTYVVARYDPRSKP